MLYHFKQSTIAFALFVICFGQSLAQPTGEAPRTEPELVPQDSPQSQTLTVDREEFSFELRDGVLSVKHYAKDAIGFAVATKDPTPVRSLSLIPNFLLTVVDRKTKQKSLVMLDIVSMTLSEQVNYTLGKNIDAVQIMLLPPQGFDLGLPPTLSLRDPNPNFSGVRPADFDKFRKIPIGTQDKKIAIPLLPGDQIRSLLFAKGTDVRMYYVDLNDQNQDEDGFFLFRLEGKTLNVSHYGAKKLRFDSFSGAFELSVPPHPFSFSVVSGPEIFHLDPADFGYRSSASYQLPNEFEALEIWSADPNTLSSLFQGKPSLVRNSVLSGVEKPVAFRATKPAASRNKSHAVLISKAQNHDNARGSLRYVDSSGETGLKQHGEFRFSLTPDFRIMVSHHHIETAHFSAHNGNQVNAAINPDFSLRFTLVIDDQTKAFELKPEAFKDGIVVSEQIPNLAATKNIAVITENVTTNHKVFFETLKVDLRRSGISCMGTLL